MRLLERGTVRHAQSKCLEQIEQYRQSAHFPLGDVHPAVAFEPEQVGAFALQVERGARRPLELVLRGGLAQVLLAELLELYAQRLDQHVVAHHRPVLQSSFPADDAAVQVCFDIAEANHVGRVRLDLEPAVQLGHWLSQDIGVLQHQVTEHAAQLMAVVKTAAVKSAVGVADLYPGIHGRFRQRHSAVPPHLRRHVRPRWVVDGQGRRYFHRLAQVQRLQPLSQPFREGLQQVVIGRDVLAVDPAQPGEESTAGL